MPDYIQDLVLPRNINYYRFFVFIIIVFFTGCGKERSYKAGFYYWKTLFDLSETEQSQIGRSGSTRLYVRMMDIDWDTDRQEAVPVSPVLFRKRFPDSLRMIPVIFIVNNTLQNLHNKSIRLLASKIIRFTEAKVKQAGVQVFSEIQIDCDWTRTTKDNYFLLLRELDRQLPHKLISVTLRLHQYKNRSLGIPPADRVMLMCYNMGNLRKYGQHNSILNIPEMKRYLDAGQVEYPLPIDIALPIFRWTVVFRSKQYAGITRISPGEFENKLLFKKVKNSLYEVQRDIAEYGIRKRDELRYEAVTFDELKSVAQLISKSVKLQDSLNIVYYHLDDNLLNNYQNGQLEEIFHFFN